MAFSNAKREPRREEGPTEQLEPSGGAVGLPDSDWRSVLDRELSAGLARFAAGIAHEARNQIFAVTATLDAFEARFSDATQTPPHFAVMRDDLQRLTALMHGLAEFGHPTAPALAFGHVGHALSDALSAARPSAERKKLVLSAQLDEPRATAWFDRERLSVAARSLLEHAIRRSPEAAAIELCVTRGDGEEGLVTVTVTDQGPALGPEQLDRVFEPFFSANRAARGLDLALAKRIVEQHGGGVRAANRDRTGLCLALVIPGSGGA
jgi:two-component system sensor histidine kinase HydH